MTRKIAGQKETQTISVVIRAVCRQFGTTLAYIRVDRDEPNHNQTVALARRTLAVLLADYVGLTQMEIERIYHPNARRVAYTAVALSYGRNRSDVQAVVKQIVGDLGLTPRSWVRADRINIFEELEPKAS